MSAVPVPELPAALCPDHGTPLFRLAAGVGWLACRHCLENSCDVCEEPQSLCRCRDNPGVY